MSVTSTKPAENLSVSDRIVPLWRNLQFQTLWFGQASATLGVSVADVAYPLAILAITGSPGRAGLFAAVQSAGMLVAGLPAGQLADRCDRRTIVIGAETGRAVVTAFVAAGLIAGWLSLPMLLAAAVLLGVGQSVSGAARLPLLRSVVPPQQLTTALVQDEVRQSGAGLAGPPLAGVLYAVQAAAHAVPFLFTAASFALSAVSAVLMKVMPGGARAQAELAPATAAPSADGEPDATPAPAARSSRSGMLTGIKTLWSYPLLRTAMILLMMVNTVGSGIDLIIIVILRHQHVHPGEIGLVLACGAVGGLAGAPLVKPLHRLRPGVLLLALCLVVVATLALLALPYGPWWVGSLLFADMLGVPAVRVLLDVLVLRRTPDAERGRVIAAVMVLLGLGTPVGVGVAGLLLEYLSAPVAMLTLAAVLAAVLTVFATRRELVQARWPQ